MSGVSIAKRILKLLPRVTENLAIGFVQASLILVCSWQWANLDIVVTKANKEPFSFRSGDLGGQFIEPPH